MVSCTADPALDMLYETPGYYLLVSNAATDFQTATLGLIDLDNFQSAPDLTSVHSDSRLRIFNDAVFVINRLGADNIQRIDRDSLTTQLQISTGSGSNPQDLLVVSTHRGYITRYNETALWVVDPVADDANGFFIESIDLAEHADADGIPEMGEMVLWEDTVYLALQRLDRFRGFQATSDSLLISLDAESGEVGENTWTTPVPNPISLQVAGGFIWLVCAGEYGELDGAVVRFNPANKEFEVFMTEMALGGEISALSVGEGHFIALIDDQSSVSVWSFSSETGEILEPVVSGLPYFFSLVQDDTYLYVPDRSPEESGIRIFNRVSYEAFSTSPIRTGLPPWDMVLVERD
jgi:hypothetical protein